MIENRAFGTEMEWGLMVVPTFYNRPDKNGGLQYELLGDADIRQLVREHTPTTLTDLPPHLPRHLGRICSMLSNGGKFYEDHGHLEYCTPEVTTLDDLVASEIAGERITYLALKNAVEKRLIKNFILNKRVIDSFNSSWGYHENYQVDRRYLDVHKRKGEHAPAFNLLAAHFATRPLYTGAGAMRQGRFLVGQKTSVVTHEYSLDTVNQKPLINLRDETHGDESKYARLHVPCVDPHMSPWALRMSVGTTNLILSMIEDGFDFDHNDLHFAQDKLVTIANTVAANLAPAAQFPTKEGKPVTALQMQQTILSKVKEWAASRTLSSDEQWVLEEWERTLALLASNPSQLKDRVEWICRQKWHSKHDIQSTGTPPPDTLELVLNGAAKSRDARDLQWDRIAAAGSIGLTLRNRLWHPWMVDEALIAERMVFPPQTRAWLRHAFIKRHESTRYAQLHWETAILPTMSAENRRITMPDPRSAHHAELEELLARPTVLLASQR